MEIDGCKVKMSKCTKLLGIYIDSDLKWNTQVNNLLLRLHKSHIHMAYCKPNIPYECRKILYYAYFNSLLTYGLKVWGPHISKKQTEQINISQRKMIRIMTNSKKDSHTNPMFKKLSILKFTDMIRMEKLKYAYKLYHQNLPNAIMSQYAYNKQNKTRGGTMPNMPQCRTKFLNQSLYASSIMEWQNTKIYIKQRPSLTSFVNRCKSHFISYIILLTNYHHSKN